MSKEKLDFSIIIPTYMRPKALETCLTSIYHLDYPKDKFEVIVVDDGSSVSLKGVVNLFTCKMDVKLFRQSNAGPGVARNYGAQKARGRFLAFTDDDCEVDKYWLKAFGTFLKKNPHHFVGGKTINRLEKKIFSATSQLIVDIVYHGYNPAPEKAQFFASNNIALAREDYLRLQGFDPFFRVASEDRDFCYRWLQSGKFMFFLDEGIIYHSHHLHLKSFFRQHFNYGRGAFRYFKMRKIRKWSSKTKLESAVAFHLNPLFWVYHLFSNYSLLNGIRFSFALVVWQIANSFGFLWELIDSSCRKKSRYIPY